MKAIKAIKAFIYTITALVIFAQGLYFSDQWMMALMVVSVILLVRVWRQGHLYLAKDPVLIYLGFMVCLQCLGYIYYVERGMLIFGVLRVWLYLLFYLLLMQIKEEQVITHIKEAFVVIMVVSGGFSSILYGTGWLPSLAYVIDHRLAGPLQYANTYGLLLIVAIMLVLTLEISPRLRYLALLVLTIAVMLTMSRAIYVIGFVMVMVLLISSKATKATYVAVITSIIVGALVLSLFDQSGTVARLTEATGASEWQSRLLYYKDAITMILKHPMGYGTNGYHYAQSFYQTGSTYHVKYVHSSLLQSFLDLGLLGGLTSGLFMVWAVFFHAYKLSTRIIVMTLLGHSLMDLDLQFPAVWLLLLLLLYRSDRQTAIYEKTKVWPLWLGVTLGLGLTLWLSLAVVEYNRGAYAEAIKRYGGYTEAYRQLLNKRQADDAMVPYALALVEKNPYVTELYPALIDYYASEGTYDLAVKYAKDYVDYSPIIIDHHVTYAETLTLAATYYLVEGHPEKAEIYTKAMLLVPGRLAELAKEKNTDYNVNHKPDLTMNSALMDAYIEAGYIMEKINYGR